MKTISCVLFNAVVFLVLASAFAPQKAAAQTRDTMTVQPNYQVYQQAPAIAITPKEVMVAAPPPPQPVPTVSEVGAIKTLVVPSAPPPASPPPPMTAIQEVPKLIAGDPCLAKGTTDSLEYQCCKMASKSGDTAVRLTREGTGGMNQDIYDCCVNKAIPVHPDTAVTPDETQQCSCSINPRNTACFSCFGRQSVDQFVSCFSQQASRSRLSNVTVDYTKSPGKAVLTFTGRDTSRETMLNLCACASPQPLNPAPACTDAAFSDPLSLACYDTEQIDDLKRMGYTVQPSDDGKSLSITDFAKTADECKSRGGQPATPPPPPPPPPPTPAPAPLAAEAFKPIAAEEMKLDTAVTTGDTGSSGATGTTGATGATGTAEPVMTEMMVVSKVTCVFTRPLCVCEAPPPPPDNTPPPPAPTPPPPVATTPPATPDLRAAMCRWGDTEARMLDTGETVLLKEPCEPLDLSVAVSDKARDLYKMAGEYYKNPTPDMLAKVRAGLSNQLANDPSDDGKSGYGVALMTLPPKDGAEDGATITNVDPKVVHDHYVTKKDIELSAADGKIRVKSPDALSLVLPSAAAPGGPPQLVSASDMLKTMSTADLSQASVTLIRLDMAEAEGRGCSLVK